MNVHLGEEDSLGSPLLVVSEIVLDHILDLDDSVGAFVGISAAKGSAVEKHDILNWYFCPFGEDSGVDVEDDIICGFRILYIIRKPQKFYWSVKKLLHNGNLNVRNSPVNIDYTCICSGGNNRF